MSLPEAICRAVTTRLVENALRAAERLHEATEAVQSHVWVERWPADRPQFGLMGYRGGATVYLGWRLVRVRFPVVFR